MERETAPRMVARAAVTLGGGSKLNCRFDGESAPRAGAFTLGMWYGEASHPHTVPAVRRCAGKMAAVLILTRAS